jgi:phosphoribosyl 1,2-cyclic phosphodiesterase
MRLKFLGVRGSRPCHKRGILGFGGNSTSMQFLQDEDFHLLLDGGTGLAHLGLALGTRPALKKFHVLVTHTHWDHILGFPLFEPMQDPACELTFHASNTSRANFHELFVGLQRKINLPVPASAFQASINFSTVTPGVPFQLGKITVDTFQLNHQGITLAFKLKSARESVVVITDNAPAAVGNLLGEGMAEKAALHPGGPEVWIKEWEQALVDFLRGVHTVVFDSHFTEENLKPDWGHSTAPRALSFCVRAGVKRLILFHHAPEDLDSAIDLKVAGIVKEAALAGIEVDAAREGETWLLRSA